MVKKLHIIIVLLLVVVFTGCSQQSNFSYEWVPEIFSMVPWWYDQLLYIDVDEHIKPLLELQLWWETDLSWLEEVVLRQNSEGEMWQSLLFVKWTWVDVEFLRQTNLIPVDDSFISKKLDGWVRVFWEATVIDQALQDWKISKENLLLLEKYAAFGADVDENIVFLSRPSDIDFWWLAKQFSEKLIGTIWVAKVWSGLPVWTIGLLFEKWIVPKNIPQRESVHPKHFSSLAPIRIQTSQLLSQFRVPKLAFQTVFPLFVGQYIGDALSLLDSDDYMTLYDAFQWPLLVEVAPTESGRAWNGSVFSPKIFDLLKKAQPFLDGYIHTILFQWMDVKTTSTDSLIKRSLDAESEDSSLVTVENFIDHTQIQFLWNDMLQGSSLSWDSMLVPENTLWLIDIDVPLIQALIDPSWVFPDQIGSSLHATLRSDPDDEMIHIEFWPGKQ